MRMLFSALALVGSLSAQAAPAKSILGTVTGFKMSSLEIGLKLDEGAAMFFKISPQTDVVQVAPGERDLAKAKKIRVTDLALNDRVLVSFVDGMKEARRIVMISADDIEKRNEAERLDWQKRGITGIVTAKNGDEITLHMRTVKGPPEMTIVITPKTMIRRYAADSVKFADAEWSNSGEIGVGDQLRARGDTAGTTVTAQDIVFGTFLSRIGNITAINADARTITIDDLVTKKPVTIRVTSDTQLKAMPDFRALFSKGGKQHEGPQQAPPAGFEGGKIDVAKLIDSMGTTTFEKLKIGGAVMVSSTRGSKPDVVTATRIIANADFLIETAQAAAAEHEGMSVVDVISRLHGGAMGGPTGLALPGIVQ